MSLIFPVWNCRRLKFVPYRKGENFSGTVPDAAVLTGLGAEMGVVLVQRCLFKEALQSGVVAMPFDLPVAPHLPFSALASNGAQKPNI